jgi:acyl-CoA synthetase (AMP-forming)/AMP-acid ligase II
MCFNNFYDFIKYYCFLNSNKDFYLSLNKIENIKYQELFEFIQKFNAYLINNKIKQQDKIITVFDNSKLLILLFLSIIANNRIFIPINPNSGQAEMDYILKKTKPKIILIDDNLINKFNFDSINVKKKILNQKKFINFVKNLKIKKDAYVKFKIAEILFTSGSTGQPKGVVLTHKSMLENLHGIYEALKIKFHNNLKFLSTTPLYHNNGQFIPTLLPIIYGASSSTIPPESSLLTFWKTCTALKINYSSVMSTHIQYFNAQKSFTKHNIKGLFCGGAKLNNSSHKKFEKKFQTKIFCNYGLTETSSIASTEGFGKNSRRIGSVGKPLHNNLIKIKKSNHGEILIKGKNLFLEYFNDKILSKKKINKKGWFSTGDTGYFDKDGYLYIKDRIDNMINVSGENIYPSEIENHIFDLKEVKTGILTSLPDPITQNKLIFIYESDTIIDYTKFYNFFKLRISKFKIPKKIYHVSEVGLREIPKAPNKKILRSKIKKYLENISGTEQFYKIF